MVIFKLYMWKEIAITLGDFLLLVVVGKFYSSPIPPLQIHWLRPQCQM